MELLELVNGVTSEQIDDAIKALVTKRIAILNDIMKFSIEMNVSDARKALEQLDKCDELIVFVDGLRPVCNEE